MNRRCTIIRSSIDYGSGLRRHICVDSDNADEIYSAIEPKGKKFSYIIERTLTQNFLYWDCYDKEDVNSQTRNVTAIKFFDADNTRIYCVEQSTDDGDLHIICVTSLNKKAQKNNKAIKDVLESISKYRYEIE